MRRYDLTATQHAIWLAQHIYPEHTMYNVGGYALIRGRVSYEVVRQAIGILVATSDVFSLRFTTVAGNPRQSFDADFSYDLDYVDFSGHSHPDQACLQWIEQDFGRHLPVTGKLFQTTLLRGATGSYWYVKMHHLLADGYALSLVFNQVAALYARLREGLPVPATAVETPYASFLEANKNYRASERLAADRQFWLRQYEHIPDRLTLGKTRKADEPGEVARTERIIPRAVVEDIRKVAHRYQATTYHFFLAVLYTFFSRVARQNRFVLNLPVFNRSTAEAKQTLGTCINVLPFLFEDYSEATFGESLARIKKHLFACYKHHPFTAHDLRQTLQLPGSLFTLSFSYQKNDYQDQFGGLPVDIAYLPARHQFEDIVIHLIEYNQEAWDVKLIFDYRQDAFRAKVIEKWLDTVLHLVQTAVRQPESKIKTISLLPAAEEERLLRTVNQTRVPYPKRRTVHALFREQAQKTPERAALIAGSHRLTYRELDAYTDYFAAQLQQQGVTTGTVVPIVAHASGGFVKAVLSVLKAGGTYVPIDPQLPLARIHLLLKDSQAPVVLVQKECIPTLGLALRDQVAAPLLPIPDECEAGTETPVRPCAGQAGDIAYIIYTSGTTGTPKGVRVSHQNLVNYCGFAARTYVKGEKVNFPLFTSVAYDLGVTALFTPLLTGNAVVVYPEMSHDLILEKIIREKQVEAIKLTPSHLKLLRHKDCRETAVRRLVVGGEELETQLALDILEQFGGRVEIYNEYGPAEATVGCTMHAFDPAQASDPMVSIGRPVDNTQIYLLDPHLQPVPVGVAGEICVGGDGVAHGYVNQSALTTAKFIHHALGSTPQRLYKTGDLACWSPEGTLTYLGRMDEQVKIKGHRIEPGEVESQLSRHPAVRDVKVVAGGNPGEKYLCAYYVAEHELSGHEWRAYAGQTLDPHRIPQYFVRLRHIPLTANGKVDKEALPEPAIRSAQKYQAPRNPAEAQLAAAWQQILKVDTVGITDNFFDLGGDSIKAVQIIGLLGEAGIAVTVRDMMTAQTIEGLASGDKIGFRNHAYSQESVAGNKGFTPIEKWFFAQRFTNPNYYHQSVVLRFTGPVVHAWLEQAWQQVIGHHDGLRLNFDPEQNHLFFGTHRAGESFSIPTVDFTPLPDHRKPEQLAETGTQCKRTLDITRGVLIRLVHIHWAAGEHKLLIVIHHLAVDGISWRILLQDFYTAYTALQHGQTGRLPKKTASLPDWQQQLRRQFPVSRLLEEKPYWEEMLAADFTLPYDFATNDWQVRHRQQVRRKLSRTDTQVLAEGARTHYRTGMMVLLVTALTRTLRAWTKADTCRIEVENHGRYLDDCDVSRTVGWFTTLFPVRLPLHESASWPDQIRTVKEHWSRIPNQGMGYGMLAYVHEQLPPDPQRPDVRFNYLGQFDAEADNELFVYTNEASGPDTDENNEMTAALEINCMTVQGELVVEIGYSTARFRESTLDAVLQQYIRNIMELKQHLQEADTVYFTPSDFDTLDIGQDDLEAIFT